MSLEFKDYSVSNKAYKYQAPMAVDKKKPKQQDGKKDGSRPALGEDYKYGFAQINIGRKYAGSAHSSANPIGWLLPGAQWTNKSDVVFEKAKTIDRMIINGGGLPHWANKQDKVAA